MWLYMLKSVRKYYFHSIQQVANNVTEKNSIVLQFFTK